MDKINNYQLVNPVLIIISIGLIAYLIYLTSLLFLGLTFRTVENMILILVIAALVVIITILISQESEVQEKISRILGRKNLLDEEEMYEEIPHDKILKELEKMLTTEKMNKMGETEITEGKGIVEEKPTEERPLKTIQKETGPSKISTMELDREKLYAFKKLLKTGIELKTTNAEGAKEAFIKARKVYNSVSPDGKKLVNDEVVRLMVARFIGSKKETSEEKE